MPWVRPAVAPPISACFVAFCKFEPDNSALVNPLVAPPAVEPKTDEPVSLPTAPLTSDPTAPYTAPTPAASKIFAGSPDFWASVIALDAAPEAAAPTADKVDTL